MTVDREWWIQLLQNKGMRVTPQRLAVLRVLSLCPDKHLTAEEIYDLVKREQPDIGLATIYRNLQKLLELNLVDRMNLDDGYVRYEICQLDKTYTKHHHHHIICLKCGKVISFEGDLLDELETKITETTGFEIIDHEVKLYGHCKQCGGKTIEKKE